jgi:Leucine-rich repeat (LRR) protein
VNRLVDLRGLSRMVSLEELALKDNALTSLAGIHHLPNLRDLVVDINQVRPHPISNHPLYRPNQTSTIHCTGQHVIVCAEHS